MPPPHCVSLWIGPSLGLLERACLRSVLRQGHSLSLYCYRTPEGVPEGVELADAAQVVPESEVVPYRNGSYSLFSNRFRYELQRRALGTWLDCDAYLLAPLDSERPYLVGEEASGILNGGVLRMPPASPILPVLLRHFEEREVPRWLPSRAWLASHLRRALTGRTGIADMPWGTFGPKGLSAVARQLGVNVEPLPAEVLYPVAWQDAEWITDPNQKLEDRITGRTISVHLWNERIKHLKDSPAAPGSFLARLNDEGA